MSFLGISNVGIYSGCIKKQIALSFILDLGEFINV